jgi:hypothetical protein
MSATAQQIVRRAQLYGKFIPHDLQAPNIHVVSSREDNIAMVAFPTGFARRRVVK